MTTYKHEITSKTRTTQVAGKKFEVVSDYIYRGTFAKDLETGEEKVIKSGGYISNDLTTRKAIAAAFNLSTFRK